MQQAIIELGGSTPDRYSSRAGTRHRLAAGTLALGLAAVAACRPEASTDERRAEIAAAERLADSDCRKYKECMPVYLELDYGAVEDCTERMRPYFVWAYTLPGTLNDADALASCQRAIDDAPCTEYRAAVGLAECRGLARGSRENGEACTVAGQCASGLCDVGTEACGVCADPPGAGDPCTDAGRCGPGLGCADDTGTCLAVGRTGEPCGADTLCEDGASCVDGECLAWLTEAGAGCGAEAGQPECDTAQYLWCNDGACATSLVNAVGEPCGLIAGTWSYCGGGTFCDHAERYSGTCVAGPALGEPCDDAGGPYCWWPERCRNGTCSSPTESSCD
ncbi:MAG: hypothetical protein JW751_27005 [Polyangiaceae bacterium]|nr:hypothetical protein [Polyangiaceae bacterium]